VREDQRLTPPGCRTLVHKVEAFPDAVLETTELPFPRAPIELIGPISYDVPQPFQFGALVPPDTGYLVGPSRIAQPCAQVVEHLIRDMNPKWLHHRKFLLDVASPRRGKDQINPIAERLNHVFASPMTIDERSAADWANKEWAEVTVVIWPLHSSSAWRPNSSWRQ
jgi:hypothetical protein